MPRLSLSSGSPGHDKRKMTAPDLPAELKAALDARLQGFSRSDASVRSASISRTYRDGGGSAAIRSETDALAYALARMPATYAAVTASLNALREIAPGFAPKTLLDVGAGPGTASWAAAEAFSSLQGFALAGRQQGLARAGARSRRRQRAARRVSTTATARPAPCWPRRRRPTSWWRAT